MPSAGRLFKSALMTTTVYSVLFVLVVLAFSCKKDDAVSSPSQSASTTSLIKRVAIEASPTANAATIDFYYAGDSTVDSIIYHSSTGLMMYRRTFEHSATRIIATEWSIFKQASTRDTFWLDGQGRVARQRIKGELGGGDADAEYVFVYDSSGRLSATVTLDLRYPNYSDTMRHWWDGGNMVSTKFSSGDSITYNYSATENSLRGESLHLQALIRLGYNTRPAVNRLISSTISGSGGAYTTTFNHITDALGRLTRVSNSDGGISNLEYY